MANKRTVLLGVFLLITLSVLGYFTLFMTDFTLFKQQPRLVVQFSETNGLREGDSVLVAGMRWGRVKQLTFDPRAPNDRRIKVVAALNEPLVLREGFTIAIEDATLLGGKNLSIDPGPFGAPEIAAGQELHGEVAPNPIDALGNMVKESSTGVEQIVDDLQVLSQTVREGRGTFGRLISDEAMAQNLSDAMASLAKTLADMQTVTADLAAGRGTAGRLLEDDALYVELLETTRKLNETLAGTTEIVRNVTAGNGVAGRLLSDPELADRFTAMIENVSDLTARLSRGEGTLGRLVADDTIARNIEVVTQRLADGEGAAGLLARPEVYDNILEISDNLAVTSAAIRNGQGTVGKLVMDPELYNQVRNALGVVQRSLEEYREAAPITTFTSVFFAAF